MNHLDFWQKARNNDFMFFLFLLKVNFIYSISRKFPRCVFNLKQKRPLPPSVTGSNLGPPQGVFLGLLRDVPAGALYVAVFYAVHTPGPEGGGPGGPKMGGGVEGGVAQLLFYGCTWCIMVHLPGREGSHIRPSVDLPVPPE